MSKIIHDEDIYNITKSINNDFKKLKNKKILLIGYNGFLGKYFVDIFSKFSKEINFELDCCDNFISSKKNKFKNKRFKYIHGDIVNINLKKKYDLIICLAGIASPALYKKFPMETLDVSYLGVKKLLNKSKKDKSQFILFSSSEIYGNPDKKNIPTKESFYGYVNSFGPRACYDEGKRIGETLCYIYKTYFNVNIKIIRPFNVFGPLMAKNQEIADEMIKIKAAIQITSNESLPHTLEELLNNDTLSKELSCNARKYAEDGGTILESISLKISPYIVGIK